MRSPHRLAIKIGNNQIGVGIFADAHLAAHFRMHTEAEKTADEYAVLLGDFLDAHQFTPAQFDGAIIVSVVPALTTTLDQLCRRYLNLTPLVVSPGLKTGMNIAYDDPRALGADRLVDAVGARAKYGAPVIVVDFGTATTFNVVNRAGDFAGGAITVGLNMAAEALYRFTAKLPRIDLAVPPRALATNTTDAMRAGLIFGYVGLTEGLIARLRAEMNEPTAPAIATGGLAPLIAAQTKIFDAVDQELAYEGLRIIYEMNTKKELDTDFHG